MIQERNILQINNLAKLEPSIPKYKKIITPTINESVKNISLLTHIEFANGKFNVILNHNEININNIVDLLNKTYNNIKSNPNVRSFSNPRFEVIVEEDEDIESGFITKIGYVVDTLFKTKSCFYDITDIKNAGVIGDICKTLNMITSV